MGGILFLTLHEIGHVIVTPLIDVTLPYGNSIAKNGISHFRAA